MTLYKSKAVEVLQRGPNFASVKYVGEADYNAFSVRVGDLVEKADKTPATVAPVEPPKQGKQRSRNYALFISVYNLLKTRVELRHEEVTKALDPQGVDMKLHHAVSAVLSGNHDVFLNNRKRETWTLQPDAEKWLVESKPTELTDAQKKATAVRRLLRAVEKGTAEAPAWLEGITLPEAA